MAEIISSNKIGQDSFTVFIILILVIKNAVRTPVHRNDLTDALNFIDLQYTEKELFDALARLSTENIIMVGEDGIVIFDLEGAKRKVKAAKLFF